MPQEKPLAPMSAEEHALWREVYVKHSTSDSAAYASRAENIEAEKLAAIRATRAVRNLREQLGL